MSDNDNTRTHQPGDHDATRSGAPAPDPDATLLKPQGQAAALAPDVGLAVPGFEIEGEIGRGGMGVVYRAKQVGLNRLVALKMLIAGPFADSSLRARFLLEAESVAALEHPHIVKVHAFGEQGHHPFLAMEFLPGGTLADRIKQTGPLSAKDATELVAKLSQAVAHAHSRGVVHRDIKPLNVMFAGDGEPRVTDFGLAKVGRADQNLTASNAVLGTPAYMAPEQAAGKVHEVGTAADVYALGALLYDALTGRPPFLGDSAAVTLQKVLTEEPQRPAQVNASIPHDLETICLKCLEKDPARRYPTAQVVADRLGQVLRGESIPERLPGSFERGYKWVKRNKVVAGASAAVALALLAGAGVSLAFGLEADRQRKNAEGAAESEAKEKRDAIDARNELKAKNDELNRTLSKALLGPIAAGSRGGALTRYETNAFWQIVGLRGGEVPLMVLEEATRAAPEAEQLESRAEVAFQAAIGPNPEFRDKADRLLFTRLTDPTGTAPQRTSLALAVAWWGDATPRTNGAAAEILVEALIDQRRGSLVDGLRVARFLPPARAARAAQRFTATMSKTADFNFLSKLARGVAAVAPVLKPEHATAECEKAAQFLTAAWIAGSRSAVLHPGDELDVLGPFLKLELHVRLLTDLLLAVEDRYVLPGIGRGLARVAPRLTREQADVCARRLVRALAEPRYADQTCALAEGYAAVVQHLPPEEAADAVDSVTEQLLHSKAWDHSDAARFLSGVSVVAQYLPPERATERLISALGRTSNIGPHLGAIDGLATALIAVAERLPRERGARQLAAAMTKTDYTKALLILTRGLAALVPGLPSEQATDSCTKAVKRIADVVGERPHATDLRDYVYALIAVAPYLPPDEWSECPRIAEVLLARLLDEATRKDDLHHLAKALAAVASFIPPAQAETACRKAAQRLSSVITAAKTDSFERAYLVEGFVAITLRLSPEEATREAQRLTEAMKTLNPSDIHQCVMGMAVIHRHLSPEGAARQVIDALVSADAGIVYHFRDDLIESLGGITSRLTPGEAISVAQLSTDALGQVMRADIRRAFESALQRSTSGLSTTERRHRSSATLLATGSLATPYNVLPSLPLLHPYFHPQPRPLPPQDLVELLKHPFCVGEARRAVLDALEFTYKRTFKDQWEFVEYVQRNNVHDHTTGKPLDLLTPPKRPEQKL